MRNFIKNMLEGAWYMFLLLVALAVTIVLPLALLYKGIDEGSWCLAGSGTLIFCLSAGILYALGAKEQA